MPASAYAAIMFTAGLGIPVLAALNANLGQRIGNPAAAAVILFLVALTVACIAALITGPKAVIQAKDAPPHLFLAGTFVAFYVLSVTWIAPHFGVGNAVFFVLLGQLVSAALIDQFGLFGAQPQALTTARIGGLAMMAGGIALIRWS